MTRNYIGSTGWRRSKITKSVPIRNQRWQPWRPSWNSILPSFPETKGQLTWTLVWSIMVTSRSNVAKILLIGNPRWLPIWKSILNFFSEPKGQLTRNLSCKPLSGTGPSRSSRFFFFFFFFFFLFFLFVFFCCCCFYFNFNIYISCL